MTVMVKLHHVPVCSSLFCTTILVVKYRTGDASLTLSWLRAFKHAGVQRGGLLT